MALIVRTDAASATRESDPARDDRGETHFEWLARIVLEDDRRVLPFTYGARGERRRWDLRAGLFATDRTRRMLLQGG